MAAADQNASVVNGAGQGLLQDLGLQTALKHILDLQAKNVIELVLGLIENAIAVKTAEESSTLEKALGILLVEGQQLTGSVADLRQSELHTIDLALAAQTVLTNEAELLVEALLVAQKAGSDVGLPVWRSSTICKRKRQETTERLLGA